MERPHPTSAMLESREEGVQSIQSPCRPSVWLGSVGACTPPMAHGCIQEREPLGLGSCPWVLLGVETAQVCSEKRPDLPEFS